MERVHGRALQIIAVSYACNYPEPDPPDKISIAAYLWRITLRSTTLGCRKVWYKDL